MSPAMLRCLAIGAALASVAPVQAADFYEGKTINLIVGNDAGSGYDSYGRLLARHMPRHIPGKPNIIVQNMPGAGSITAAQYLYVVAPKDGLAFGILFPGAILEPLTGDPAKYRYDPTKFEYLGTADSGTRLCFTRNDSTAKTFADIKTRKIVVAATAPGSSSVDYPYFFNALAGSKFEVITGYKGPGDLVLAMERGEAEGVCALDASTVSTLRPDWLENRKANFVVQAGLEPNERLLKLGIPSMWDFITEPENRAVAELIVSQQVFGRPFLAPPGAPPERMQILRAAFDAVFKDPEAIEEARRMQLELNPRNGDVVGGLVKKVYASPKALIDRMAKAVRP
jgi:tripartite-type tricarboxylate transporter receptor subunit TctC